MPSLLAIPDDKLIKCLQTACEFLVSHIGLIPIPALWKMGHTAAEKTETFAHKLFLYYSLFRFWPFYLLKSGKF